MNRRSITLLFLAWVPFALAAQVDKSDLNGDGAVDALDLEIFSSLYLDQGNQEVDLCTFYKSSVLNEKYFRRVVKDQVNHYKDLLAYTAEANQCGVVETTTDKSDLDGDGDVDLDDLSSFSTNYLETPWQNVDWCVFHGAVITGSDFEGSSTKYYARHFQVLLDFINNHFNCGGTEPPPNNLALENSPKFLGRIANAPLLNGDYYITDAKTGSLFIYDEFLVPKGEIKGLNQPLGVAIDSLGRILVGNDGRDNVEVYDRITGELVAIFGQGIVSTPNAITVDDFGTIYVTDSRSNTIKVFDPAFNFIRTIGRPGEGEADLMFPIDVEVLLSSSNGTANVYEIFVADQGNDRVQVFDMEGNWQRSISFAGTDGVNCNWFTGVCEIPGAPPFYQITSLDTDSIGQLYVVDNFSGVVFIFDAADGTYKGLYGEYGTGSGQLRVPTDVLISPTDMAIVLAGDGDRIEIFSSQ
jgi:DNA-binding beta-propeller fold protein YncE